MNGLPVDVTDTGQWLPLTGLEPGFDQHKEIPSTDLQGREFTLVFGCGNRIRYAFDKGMVRRDGESMPCEVLPVADGLYYVASWPDSHTASTLIVDVVHGRALRSDTALGERGAPGRPVATQWFQPAVLDGWEPTGEAPARTAELIGRRVMYTYSDRHAYEHVYLNEHFYSWQCLRGPERGQADTDPATVFKLRPDIYQIAWREKVVPCAAVIAINLAAGRSHGMLFGLGDTDADTVHFTFGAYATPLGEATYPAGCHPAEPPE